MDKRILMIILIVLFLIGGYFFLFQQKSSSNDPENLSNPFPENSENYSVRTRNGKLIQTRNFLKPDEALFVEGSLTKTFLLDKNTDAEKGYQIYFYENGTSFQITIANEPVSELRKRASEELRERLGITESEACNLQVTVNTPHWVNSELAGKNLGLSFCNNGSNL